MPIVSDQYGRGPFGDENTVEQAPAAAAAKDYSITTPGFWKYLESFNRSQNPVASSLLPLAEQSQFRERSWLRDYINANAAAYGATESVDYQPSPKLTSEEANKRYPNPQPDGKPLFNEPVETKLAETVQRQKKDLFQAQTDVARFEANHGTVVNTLADITATFTDPLNVASAFLPVFGEQALVSRIGLGLAARVATRAAIGAEAGAMQQGINAGIKLGTAEDTRSDFTIRDALQETLLGAVGGAALNVAFGSLIIDPLKYAAGKLTKARIEAPAVATADAETNHAAAQSAISQIVTGRPVDVADLFPKPKTETSLGMFMNHPFLERVEAADLGLDRREVARSLDRKTIGEVERLEKQKTDLSAQMADMNAARARGDVNAGELVRDQITQLETQLDGKLSKAKRASMEQQLADLKEQVSKIPGNAEFRDVQTKLQAAENALRDMAPRLTAVMSRADETIARATAAETGARLDDLAARQNEFMTRDVSGLIDREKKWRKTGIAPGVTNGELVQHIGEVETVAKNQVPPPSIPDKPPEGWTAPPKPTEAATGEGKAKGATTAAKTEQATPTPPQKPQTFEDAYPELTGKSLLPEERAELMSAHKEVEAATLREEAYKEAATCLKRGG